MQHMQLCGCGGVGCCLREGWACQCSMHDFVAVVFVQVLIKTATLTACLLADPNGPFALTQCACCCHACRHTCRSSSSLQHCLQPDRGAMCQSCNSCCTTRSSPRGLCRLVGIPLLSESCVCHVCKPIMHTNTQPLLLHTESDAHGWMRCTCMVLRASWHALMPWAHIPCCVQHSLAARRAAAYA